MGDRAMVQIKTEEGSLYVYTHWCGYDLPQICKKAIKRAEGRWSDTPYALRILVDQITKSGRDEETGWGLLLTPNAEDEYNGDIPSVQIDLKDLTFQTLGRHKRENLTFQEISHG